MGRPPQCQQEVALSPLMLPPPRFKHPPSHRYHPRASPLRSRCPIPRLLHRPSLLRQCLDDVGLAPRPAPRWLLFSFSSSMYSSCIGAERHRRRRPPRHHLLSRHHVSLRHSRNIPTSTASRTTFTSVAPRFPILNPMDPQAQHTRQTMEQNRE